MALRLLGCQVQGESYSLTGSKWRRAWLKCYSLPVGDVAFLGRETDADLGDGSSVESVLVGIAFAVNLVEGGIYGVVVFQFHDVDTLRHLQSDVAAPLGRRFLGADVSPEGHE